jgi:3-oxoacyl-[acyl-carrier protein] reductase
MLVTGSSRGIGAGIARHFVSIGYNVLGCSRGEVEWESEFYQHTVLDVSDEHDVIRWIRKARSEWKSIDALVCSAAFAPATHPLCMTGTDVWHKALRTNLDGSFFALREVGKIMTAQRSGRIVTLSSMAAALHINGTGAYAASKSAIVEMTKVLARELSPAGITCNVVSVSVVLTDTVAKLGPTVTEQALERLTFKKPLDVKDVCHAVEFFCSPKSSTITGQVLQLGLVT